MNAIVKANQNAAVNFLTPTSLQEAMQIADLLANSDIVPKDYQRKPGNILVAMQWGAEIGLQPLQAMQNIAVINGRPSMWGDAVLALVLSSPACEYVSEDANDFDGGTAICRVKRKGSPEHVVTFSQTDAIAAGLAGKTGPWQQYPKRMRQMRARAFALRDKFADVIRGMAIAEEAMDMPAEIKMGDVEVVGGANSTGNRLAKEEKKFMSQEDFDRLTVKMIPRIQSGSAPASDAVIFLNAKGLGVLSEKQCEYLKSLEPKKFTVEWFDCELSKCQNKDDTSKLMDAVSKMKLTQDEAETVADAVARVENDFDSRA